MARPQMAHHRRRCRVWLRSSVSGTRRPLGRGPPLACPPDICGATE